MNSLQFKGGGTESEQPTPRKDTERQVSQEHNKIIYEPKFADDLTLFMAWQNWYLFQQNYVLSNLLQMQYQSMSSPFSGRNNITASTNDGSQRNGNIHLQRPRIGYTAKLAPLQKRVAAELIDFFLLLLVKLFVITYCLGEQHIDRFQYLLIIDENTTFEDLQATLLHAVLLRLVAVAYEGYCISGTLPLSNGSTLGKRIVGLQVVKCEVVQEIDAMQQTILVIPGNQVGTLRSLLRATMKNAIISLFFPLLLPFHTLANHNRLIYDIATGTIVIEKL